MLVKSLIFGKVNVLFVKVSVFVNNETVPVALGKVIVLFVVGSVTCIVVENVPVVNIKDPDVSKAAVLAYIVFGTKPVIAPLLLASDVVVPNINLSRLSLHPIKALSPLVPRSIIIPLSFVLAPLTPRFNSINASAIEILDESITYVVPFTVKLPLIIVFPPTPKVPVSDELPLTLKFPVIIPLTGASGFNDG